jgi:hypothetical protein
MTLNLWRLLVVLIIGCFTIALSAQSSMVRGRIDLFRADGSPRTDNNAGIVVWLTPSRPQATVSRRPTLPRPKINQRNKRFETRVLAVEKGSVVEFPNLDPFFHNVFSLFEGKRFDLGLYEAGSTRSVTFDQPGICYIFCNIHSQMNAAVIVVDTPHFVTLSAPGEFQIPDVPPGRYQFRVWAERCSQEVLSEASKTVTVEGATMSLPTIRLRESGDVAPAHANKYGKAYEAPVFPSPIYTRP